MPDLPESAVETEPATDQQFTVDLLQLSFSDTIFAIELSRDD